ncbi:hypothetical protein BGZ65_009171, partial [Modicella reniformis]
NLEGDAKAWWRDSNLDLDTLWTTFRKAFTDYFTPPDTPGLARQELSKLRQRQLSVADYTAKFRRLVRLIPSLDNETTLYLYNQGLEPATSKEVRLRQPTTLSDAIKQATIVHNILHPVAPTMIVSTNQTTQQSTTEPMDLDSLRVLLANLTPLVSTTTGINVMQRPLGKLSAAERERLRRIGACFRCRRPGHRATECRSGRTLNNLETENNADKDDSGKDQGEA